MGSLVSREITKRGRNPFQDAIGRDSSGALTVNLRQVIDSMAPDDSSHGRMEQEPVNDLLGELGDNPTLDALQGYRRSYTGSTGGDASEDYTFEFKPYRGLNRQAIEAATNAFGIKESGQQKANEIAQKGRERAKITNMGAGIASAQRQSLAAAEDAAGGTGEGGVPDVIQAGEAEGDGGGDDINNAAVRKRRASYGGAGLAMRI